MPGIYTYVPEKNHVAPVLHIHTLVCLRTALQPLPKPVLDTVWPTASSFNSQYPSVSLTSSSGCLPLLHRLTITSTLPLNNVFYKAVPTQDVTNPVSLPSFLLHVWYSSPPWLYITLLHLSHDRSKRSSPSFPSRTHFKTLQVFLIYHPKCPQFQHHTKLLQVTLIATITVSFFYTNTS
jgi:hypothetical protein